MEVQVLPAAEPVQPTTSHSRAIEIRLGAGRSVLVEPGFDAHHLRAVLAALEMRATLLCVFTAKSKLGVCAGIVAVILSGELIVFALWTFAAIWGGAAVNGRQTQRRD